MENTDVVVIGAGPAGLFCAIQAALPGHRVLLLEKNPEPGAKLLLSGSGQCNITHDGEIRDFLSHYGDHGKQVRPALFGFTNDDLREFFRTRGLAMVTDENGKVFPKTRRSADVLALLLEECKERGVDLRCSEPATGARLTAEGFEITTQKTTYLTPVLVLSTGGASYPGTGSTGDGYRISESLGQPLTETAPALTPLLVRDYPFAALSGISFERMHFSVWRKGKKLIDRTGDILFTHRGLSGPGILDASRYIRPDDVVKLSFVGNLKQEEFAADLAKRIEENSLRFLSNGSVSSHKMTANGKRIPDIVNISNQNHAEATADLKLFIVLCIITPFPEERTEIIRQFRVEPDLFSTTRVNKSQ